MERAFRSQHPSAGKVDGLGWLEDSCAVSMEKPGEKTGKAETVELAMRSSFRISMKESICMLYEYAPTRSFL